MESRSPSRRDGLGSVGSGRLGASVQPGDDLVGRPKRQRQVGRRGRLRRSPADQAAIMRPLTVKAFASLGLGRCATVLR